MYKSLLSCAFPCAHYAGRTPRRVGMYKSLLSCAFPCAHYARRTPRRVGMNKSLLSCAFPCAHYAGRTPRRVGINKSLLSCAFPCAHYAGRTPRRVGMDKSLLSCAFPCAHYAGRTQRRVGTKKIMKKYNDEGIWKKAGAMGAQVLTLHPFPLKIQRYKENIRKKNKIREIFIEKMRSAFMAKSPYFAPPRAPTAQGAQSGELG